MSEFEQIIEVIQSVRKKITDDADVIWTPYKNPFELQREIDKELEKFQNGNSEALQKFDLWFGPTGTFQEVSLSNGWGEEFIILSDRFDKLYEQFRK